MTAAEVAPVVRRGEIWESRDSRDIGKGPWDPAAGRALPRQVRVVRVQYGRVLYENVVTRRMGSVDLVRFASRRARGGYRKVWTPDYEYRVTSPAVPTRPRLSRAMREAGYVIERRPQGMTDRPWEVAP